MAGKLFVIDGVDGSGKNTQAMQLYLYFISQGFKADEDVTIVSFPRYHQPSCKMVEMYLNGELTNNLNDIDPYTASMFYAIDRSISFKTEKWGEVYRNGGIVIADRYYTSNIIHQGAKIFSSTDNRKANGNYYLTADGKFQKFKEWLYNLELQNIGIPSPDKIFWLMTDETSNDSMLQHRVDTDPNHVTDIHEKDRDYLGWCRYALNKHKQIYEAHIATASEMRSLYTVKRREEFINVLNDKNEIRSIEEISAEIIELVYDYLHP